MSGCSETYLHNVLYLFAVKGTPVHALKCSKTVMTMSLNALEGQDVLNKGAKRGWEEPWVRGRDAPCSVLPATIVWGPGRDALLLPCLAILKYTVVVLCECPCGENGKVVSLV